MKKRDFILILAILFISLTGAAFSLPRGAGASVEIYRKSALVGSYDLYDDKTISFEGEDGIINVIQIQNGRVSFREATCPNRICVECGWIEKRGETICCAPAGLLVIIRGMDGGYDAVTK